MTRQDTKTHRILPTLSARLLCATALALGASACGSEDFDDGDVSDAGASFRASGDAYVEFDNVMFGSDLGFIELDNGALSFSTGSSWHIRLITNVANSDCIKGGVSVYLRTGPVGETAQHYYPLGLTSTFGHSESWYLSGASVADPNGCLAPGDTFTLRSNRDGTYLSDEPITLTANDGYGIYDDGSTLEYNNVSLAIGSQAFDMDTLDWVELAQTKWSLRSKVPVTGGCVKNNAALMIGLQAFADSSTPAPFYFPLGMTGTIGHSESWKLVRVGFADPNGCLAPGDQFKLQSNRDGSFMAGGEVLTLGTHDDYALVNYAPDGDAFDFDGINAIGGTLSLDHEWVTVVLPAPVSNPVIIAGPASYAGPDPVVVRVRNVTKETFDIRLQEWEHYDQTHAYETVSFMVLSAGVYVSNSGSIVEAGSFMADGTSEYRTPRSFSANFSAAPKLFATTESDDDGEAISVRVDNVDADGFEVILDEQEANVDGHGDERIAYLAIEGTPADTASQSNLITTASVAQNWVSVAGIELLMQEEKSFDNEVGHNSETVHVLSVTLANAELLFAQDVQYNGADTASLRWR